MFTLQTQWDPRRFRSQDFDKSLFDSGELSLSQYICYLLCQVDQCLAVGDVSSQQLSTQMTALKMEISKLLTCENMMTILCKAFDDFLNYKPTAEALATIVRHMSLTKDKEIQLLVSVSFCVSHELRLYAKSALKDNLSGYLQHFINNSSFCSFNSQVLQRLLFVLESSKQELNVDQSQLDAFKAVIQKHYQQGDATPLIIRPFVTEKRTSMSPAPKEILIMQSENEVCDFTLESLLREAGLPVIADKSALRVVLKQLRPETHLSPKAVAMSMCMFLQSCVSPSVGGASMNRSAPTDTDAAMLLYTTGLTSLAVRPPVTGEMNDFSVDNFFDVLLEMHPKFNFQDVIPHMDCPRFSLTSSEALALFKRCLARGLKDSFPTHELFYRPWKHSLSQLCLLRQCIENPHIINLDLFPHRTVDLTQIQGANHPTTPSSDTYNFWQNLDLVEALLRIGEADLGDEVMKIMKKPCSEHAEVILCGLLQSQTKMSPLKQNLMMALIKRNLTTSPLPLHTLKMVWESDNKENKPSFRDIFIFIVLKDFYEKTSVQERWVTVERACVVAGELRAFGDFLDIQDLRFNMRFTIVAFKDDEVVLEKHFRLLHEKYGIEFQMTLPEILEGLGKSVAIIVRDTAQKVLGPAFIGFPLPMKEPTQPGGGQYPLDLSLMESHINAAGMKDSSIVGNSAVQRLFSQGGNMMAQGSNPYAARSMGEPSYSSSGRLASDQQQIPPPNVDGDAQMCEEILARALRHNGVEEYMKCVNNLFNVTDHVRVHFGMVKHIFRFLHELDTCNEKEKFIDIMVQALRMIPVQRLAEAVKSLSTCTAQSPYSVSEIIVRLSSHTVLDPLVLRHFASQNVYSRLTPNCQKFISSVFNSEESPYGDIRKYRMMDSRSSSLAPGSTYMGGVLPSGTPAGPGSDLSTGMAVGSQRLVSNPSTHSRSAVPGSGAQSQDMMNSSVSMFSGSASSAGGSLIQQQRRYVQPVDGGAMQPQQMPPQAITSNLIQTAHSDQRARHNRDEQRPSNDVQSSVSFIFNNVCRSNVDSKVRELIEVVPPESVGWLVKSIVVRRVTSDQNFHELFLHIIDALNERYSFVRNKAIQDVLKIIRHILNRINHSDDDFNNRTILKYLANFLGLLTLSKNRPILSEEINFKELLCEAFNLGTIEMNFVVPFVSRCLEHVKNSKVFKPPNPWTMGHLRVLKELHSMDESDYVTSTARFEVEILFSALGLDIKEVERTEYLRVRENFDKLHQRLIGIEIHPLPPQQLHQMLPSAGPPNASHVISPNVQPMGSRGPLQTQTSYADTSILSHQGQLPGQFGQSGGLMPQDAVPSDVQSSQHAMFTQQSNQIPQRASDLPQNEIPQQSQLQTITPPIHSTNTGKIRYCDIQKLENISNLTKFIQLDSNLLPNASPEIRNHITAFIQKSFHDSLVPILERCRRQIRPTIKTLLKKDFGLDPDPARLQACSQAMTRFLASAVSLINSRELIFLSISTAYKQGVLSCIPSATSLQKEAVERAANSAAMNNIDILVAHMQKFIAETLVQEMDMEMSNEYMARFQARRDNVPFVNEARIAQINQSLPERLKKSARGPNAEEIKVYEEFLRSIPGFQPNGFGFDFAQTVMSCDIWQQNEFSKRRQVASHELPSGSSSAPGGPIGTGYHVALPAHTVETLNAATGGGSTPPTVGSAGIDEAGGNFGFYPNLYDGIFSELERQLQAISNIIAGRDPIKSSLRHLIDAVHLAMTSNQSSPPQQVLRITITNLMDNYDTRLRAQPKGIEVLERFKEAHLAVIRLMLTSELQPFSYSWITHQITNTWKSMPEESTDASTMHMGKWNFDPFTELLKIHVISLSQLDDYLAKEIERDKIRAIAFSLDLFEHYIIGEKREFTVLNEYDIYTTIERILALSRNGSPNLNRDETLKSRVANAAERMRDYLDMGLLEDYQPRGSNCLYSGCSQSREFDDQTMLAEKTEQLMRRWFEIQASQYQRDYQEFRKFLKQMLDSNILVNEESITRFFRLAAVLVVERALNKLKSEANSNAGPNARFSSYSELDAYSRLLALLIKEAGKNNDDNLAKPRLLNNALGIISGVLIQEHEVRPQWFNPMPFHRILIILFMELSDDSTLSSMSKDIMAAFCNTLHILRPARTAAFVFSWLEIVGHRVFIHRMLASPRAEEFRPMYVQLLVNLLKYIHTFLNQNHMSNAVVHLYKGTLRLFLVLNRDFPDLLSDYHALFCDYIPPTAFQLRNIILSAVPRSRAANMEPYVRHTPLQIADVVDPKGYCMSAGSRIVPSIPSIDSFLQTRTPVEFLSFLIDKLRSKPTDSYPYSVEMMSNLVIYLCITTVKYLREKNLSITKNNISPTSQMDVIQYMILNLDSAGRYLLLNVMANQLRYPNSHTYYFMQTFLFLFTEAKEEQIKEQITRVLLERLLMHRPHPWGLLATMSELMSNGEHKFWNYDFTRCAAEIESVLRSVYQYLLRQEAP